MSRWLVNAGGQQFSAGSIDELRKLARAGDLSAGDIVQPPGANEWLYALEVPELKGALRVDSSGEYDTSPPSAGSAVIKWVGAAALAGVAVASWAYAYNLTQTVPAAEDLELIGRKGLNYSEVLVTEQGAKLYATASKSAAEVAPLVKNTKAELLAKRGAWYRLRVDGKEGYAEVDAVIPAYFFADDKTKLDYDPLYKPDQYVQVSNSDWSAPPDGKPGDTIFMFQIRNDSKFAMTDLKLTATIKDARDTVLETREFPVMGIIPANESIMIGTLKTSKKAKASEGGQIMTSKSYEELLATDPTVAERWVDDVEVTLAGAGFEHAAINIVEVRAIPPSEMPKPVTP